MLPLKITLKIKYKEKSKSIDFRRVILHKKLNESKLHIVLKILAYLYFWEKKLIIEPSYRFRGYRPDLIVLKRGELPHNNNLTPEYWIECKKAKYKKMVALGRYLSTCQIFWFHKMEILQQMTEIVLQKKKNKLPSNVQLIGARISPLQWNYLVENINKKQQGLEVTRIGQNDIFITFSDQQTNQIKLEYQILI